MFAIGCNSATIAIVSRFVLPAEIREKLSLALGRVTRPKRETTRWGTDTEGASWLCKSPITTDGWCLLEWSSKLYVVSSSVHKALPCLSNFIREKISLWGKSVINVVSNYHSAAIMTQNHRKQKLCSNLRSTLWKVILISSITSVFAQPTSLFSTLV